VSAPNSLRGHRLNWLLKMGCAYVVIIHCAARSPVSQPAPPPAPIAAPAPRPGAWQPQIPTGPRKMRVGKVGEAKSLPAVFGGARIPLCSACGTAIRYILVYRIYAVVREKRGCLTTSI